MKIQKQTLSVIFRVMLIGGTIQAAMLLTAPVSSAQNMTPTDVYYLAQSLDDTLVLRYGLSDEPFQKKPISENLRPRNVFQRAVFVVEEFNLLHGNVIHQEQVDAARRRDASTTKPQDVFGLLTLVKNALSANGMFMEFDGERTPKDPSDVFQLLRQISWHHLQIADKKGIQTDWAAVPRVYDAVVRSILPAAQTMANENEFVYEPYQFPPQPVNGVLPRNIYKLIHHIYLNISRYYQQTRHYEPINILDVNDCDDVSPADVFDLIQVVAAELKAELGIQSLSGDMLSRYRNWKQQRQSIVPGHTFRLGQYIYMLTKQVLEHEY